MNQFSIGRALLALLLLLSCASLYSLYAKLELDKLRAKLELLQTTPSTHLIETPAAAAVAPSPHAAAPLRCELIFFLRIQKTGSGSFHRALAHRCPLHGQRCSTYYHLDYGAISYQLERAAQSGSPACALTLVRDPVDRFLSEFQMALDQATRHKHGHAFFAQDQWDFTLAARLQLRQMLRRKDLNITAKALKYLHFPQSPSRNRQSLYLLGFPRMGCRGTQPTRHDCLFSENFAACQKHSICATTFRNSSAAAHPGTTYDWTDPQLLARAKRNLAGLSVFGIMECFELSIELIGEFLQWNESTKVPSSHPAVHPAPPRLQEWANTVPRQLLEEIRAVNSADQLLYDYAVHLWATRAGPDRYAQCMAQKVRKLSSKILET